MPHSNLFPSLEEIKLLALPKFKGWERERRGNRIVGEDGDSSSSLLMLPCFSDKVKFGIRSLHIRSCKNLKALLEWLPNLISLRDLGISYCGDELTRRCQENTGEDFNLLDPPWLNAYQRESRTELTSLRLRSKRGLESWVAVAVAGQRSQGRAGIEVDRNGGRIQDCGRWNGGRLTQGLRDMLPEYIHMHAAESVLFAGKAVRAHHFGFKILYLICKCPKVLRKLKGAQAGFFSRGNH
ncbi:hypothetical protein CRG98_039441 [Punica granatum]|uniref:Uncharacterized protein n=1 Tax=Punica granatum TaxID=22663 RepID=A0A2I0I859_PUNGR|nr:hypothetical protein CRG98_039441 [Punica granatum]